MSIHNIISFTKFLNKFREIERSIYYSHDNRRENDAEHCWQLAMLSWYIISTQKLELSLEKILQYCMVHDIVEIYAGDVDAIGRTAEQQALKEKREKDAYERIAKEFPEAHDLLERLEHYEKKEDVESKFVYALDKVIPVINIYNDGWFWRKECNLSIEKDIIPHKDWKVQVSPEVTQIWEQLVVLLKEQESKLFSNLS